MTYFGFLILFLFIPIAMLGGVIWRDRRQGRSLPVSLSSWPVISVILVHALIALAYTTPWDNYLVATGVWWYDPDLVTGLVLGWVPIEEYTFFVVQPLFTGLWLLFVAYRQPSRTYPALQGYGYLRWLSITVLAVVWAASVMGVFNGSAPVTYLALELAWALPPIMLQLGFGADILWRYRSLVILGILPPTLYLAADDAVAIGVGTWTIDPAQSLGIMVAGRLPLEELIFFLLTNVLLVFGIILVLARESQVRLTGMRQDISWLADDQGRQAKNI